MEKSVVYIATYGSLRRGMENFGVNARGNGEYYGTGTTNDDMNLYRYGGCYFPSVSLVHKSNGKPVVVDVFKTDEAGMTGAYDMLEGYPSFYNRTQIPVTLESGETVMAWIYHIDEDQEELVESGDWCVYKRGEEYYDEV